ncbi:hypothetical protein SAMN00790413_03489 [Deinococcus hopiensis KR-140]|uniref:Uncharacterized protein n=1 Tax=Deinococcus hopiensis KR-140 TaxID=695939 RepID=A0A1W1UX76_9DEIO|nr:hypothetical protein SAMN00790413_03489 [Deinococcus hopiensis KR-140]
MLPLLIVSGLLFAFLVVAQARGGTRSGRETQWDDPVLPGYEQVHVRAWFGVDDVDFPPPCRLCGMRGGHWSGCLSKACLIPSHSPPIRNTTGPCPTRGLGGPFPRSVCP